MKLRNKRQAAPNMITECAEGAARTQQCILEQVYAQDKQLQTAFVKAVSKHSLPTATAPATQPRARLQNRQGAACLPRGSHLSQVYLPAVAPPAAPDRSAPRSPKPQSRQRLRCAARSACASDPSAAAPPVQLPHAALQEPVRDISGSGARMAAAASADMSWMRAEACAGARLTCMTTLLSLHI